MKFPIDPKLNYTVVANGSRELPYPGERAWEEVALRKYRNRLKEMEYRSNMVVSQAAGGPR